jgi:hypothetical protein
LRASASLRCLLIDEKRAHPIPDDACLTNILDLAAALPSRTTAAS